MSDAPAERRPLPIPPMTLALIAVFFGCAMDAIIKHLGASYTALLVACVRYVFGTLFSGAAMIATKTRLPPFPVLRAHAIRAIASTGAAVLLFQAFIILPLAEATAILFAAPVMIAPLARWLLAEKLRPLAMAALLVGFLGVLVTIQGEPLDAENTRRMEGVLSAVGAAVLYALSIVLLRQLAQKDSALITSFLGNLFPALYLIVPAVFLGVIPAVKDLPAFAVTGLFGFLLWFLLTFAYARAPAQRLAATEYTALIWSALLGYFFFQEVPRWQVGLGAAIIGVAVMLAMWDGRQAKLTAVPKP